MLNNSCMFVQMQLNLIYIKILLKKCCCLLLFILIHENDCLIIFPNKIKCIHCIKVNNIQYIFYCSPMTFSFFVFPTGDDHNAGSRTVL